VSPTGRAPELEIPQSWLRTYERHRSTRTQPTTGRGTEIRTSKGQEVGCRPGGQPDVGETLATVSSGPGGQTRACWAACGPSAVRFAHGKGSCCPSTAFACCSGLRDDPPVSTGEADNAGSGGVPSDSVRRDTVVQTRPLRDAVERGVPGIADGSSLGCPPPRWSTGRLSAGLRRVGWTSGRHGDGTGRWAAGPVTCRDRTVQLHHLRPARSIGR
jgi:hypothetical protein